MRMTAIIAGALLLLVGVLITARVIDFQKQENVVDIGKLEINKTEHHRPPVNTGYVLIVLGGVALVVGALARK